MKKTKNTVKITAIIMASGLSKRMGKDKLHLKINNKYVYEYILETIRHYNFFETIVSTKDNDIIEKAESLDFKGVINSKYYLGQSESIKAALDEADYADGYMFFVADQPFIKISTIKSLCDKFIQNPNNIIVPYYNGEKGNPVIFPNSMKSQLMALNNDNGGKIVIKRNLDKIIKVDIITEDEFWDIDTMDDYNKIIDNFNKKS